MLSVPRPQQAIDCFTVAFESATAAAGMTPHTAQNLATDGVYLYVWNESSRGIAKIGTGLHGTIAGHVYARVRAVLDAISLLKRRGRGSISSSSAAASVGVRATTAASGATAGDDSAADAASELSGGGSDNNSDSGSEAAAADTDTQQQNGTHDDSADGSDAGSDAGSNADDDASDDEDVEYEEYYRVRGPLLAHQRFTVLCAATMYDDVFSDGDPNTGDTGDVAVVLRLDAGDQGEVLRADIVNGHVWYMLRVQVSFKIELTSATSILDCDVPDHYQHVVLYSSSSLDNFKLNRRQSLLHYACGSRCSYSHSAYTVVTTAVFTSSTMQRH
eukprot:11278-Heterococcus_DN1.PRE.2